MRYFTHYWANWWLTSPEKLGEVLDHTAGNQFQRRGVGPGDVIYVVTVQDGGLHFLGRFEVEVVCSQKEAEERLGTTDLWEAADHAIAKLGTATPIRTDRIVPQKLVRELTLFGRDGRINQPKIRAGGRLDQQTFRGVRELTQESAATLDALLGEPIIQSQEEDEDEQAFPEGRAVYKRHKQRERSRALVERAKALKRKADPKLHCEVCGFSFSEAYGAIGEGYIEAHHTIPLGDLDAPTETKVEDLSLVCSNCHRMLHRRRPWLTKQDLNQLMKTEPG